MYLQAQPFDTTEPTYTEDDLQSFYSNLLAHPRTSDQLSIKAPTPEDRIRMVQDVARRLLVKTDESETEGPALESPVRESTQGTLSARLLARLSSDTANNWAPDIKLPFESDKIWHMVLSRLTDIVQSLERVPKLVSDSPEILAITLLSQREWDALIKLSVSVLTLCKLTKLTIT